jgi:hypothetical protein
MGDLQSRLDATFGALKSNSAPAGAEPWRVGTRHVFMSGGADADAESSEEEEAPLGVELAADLTPGRRGGGAAAARGAAPLAAFSRSFCRAVDLEAEEEDADELAARADDPMPPRETEVGAEDDAAAEAAAGAAAAPMDVDNNGAGGAPAAPARASPLRPALSRGAVGRGAKRVSFNVPDEPEPWQPPHRRAGFVPGAAVPDHVAHPERYTRYEIEGGIVVGGGVAQLGAEAALDVVAAAAAAHAADAAGAAAAAEERFRGATGGGIEFRPRPKAGEAGAAAARPAGSAAAGAAPPPVAAAASAWELDEQRDEEGGGAPAAAPARGERRYRRRAAGEEAG